MLFYNIFHISFHSFHLSIATLRKKIIKNIPHTVLKTSLNNIVLKIYISLFLLSPNGSKSILTVSGKHPFLQASKTQLQRIKRKEREKKKILNIPSSPMHLSWILKHCSSYAPLRSFQEKEEEKKSNYDRDICRPCFRS